MRMGLLRACNLGGTDLPESSNATSLYTDDDQLTGLDVSRNSDGRLEVFGVDRLGHIWHTWQAAPGADWSGHWSQLYTDGDNLCSLRVAQNADGRLEVFGVSERRDIWHTWQTTPGGIWVGRWAPLYADDDALATIDAARNGDGRLEVFGIDPRGGIWHTWQTSAGGGWVGSWRELHPDQCRLISLSVAQNADGRLELFGIDPQNNIWHTWQRYSGGAWADEWTALYTDRDQLALLDVGRGTDGRLEVVGVDPAGLVWHTAQTSAGGEWSGRWSGLSADGGDLRSVQVARNGDGRLEVFGVSPAGQVWRTRQTSEGEAWDTDWTGLEIGAAPIVALAPARNHDGRLDLFALDSQGRVRVGASPNSPTGVDRVETDTPPVPPIAGAEATDPLPTSRNGESMTDEPEAAVPGAEVNGAGSEVLPAPEAVATKAVVLKDAAPPTQTDTQTDQEAAPSDGVAGIPALRGLIVYGGVLAFAALYIDFAVVISRATNTPPNIDPTLLDSAAALAGILGSAFALRIGNPANQTMVNHTLAKHLSKARADNAKRRTKLLAYLYRIVSLEVGEKGAASWPITFGLWAYAAVGSMLVVVYVLNEAQTPGAVKALAVTFAGYVLALLTSVFRSAGGSGTSS